MVAIYEIAALLERNRIEFEDQDVEYRIVLTLTKNGYVGIISIDDMDLTYYPDQKIYQVIKSHCFCLRFKDNYDGIEAAEQTYIKCVNEWMKSHKRVIELSL